MSVTINLAGQVFGSITVLSQATFKAPIKWLCKCQCGNTAEIRTNNLRRGKTKSCGCMSREKVTTHGLSRTPTYKSWDGMIQRCFNPANDGYRRYGAQGITVCERWMSFEHFFQDMGERPPRMTLDRIDGTKGYYLENCRWATKTTQSINRKCTIFLTHLGKTMCLAEWARHLNMSPGVIEWRRRNGNSIEDILRPLNTRAKNKVERKS